MKRKLALLLAAVMVAAMVPVTAFAKVDSYISGAVVVAKDATLKEEVAPVLVIEDEGSILSGATTPQQFYLTLEGAEWSETAGAHTFTGGTATGTVMSKTIMSVVARGTVKLPLTNVKVTGAEATITISGNNLIKADKFTFAYTAASGVAVKGGAVVEVPEEKGDAKINDIVITEAVAGAIKPGAANKLTIRLYGNYEFDKDATLTITGDNKLNAGAYVKDTDYKIAADEIEITVKGEATTAAAMLVVSGIKVKATKDTETGDVAELYIKGAGIDGTSIEVAKAVEYGITFTAENKALPVIYSGRDYATNKKTLTVTIKETAPKSWWTERRTTLVFPEGIEVVNTNVVGTPKNVSGTVVSDENKNEIDLTVVKTDPAALTELKLEFELAAAPTFTGDVTVELTGPAVGQYKATATVATVEKPVEFEVVPSDVAIDYRKVAVGDIIVKEAFAGALKAGKTLTFAVDHLDLEAGVKFVVDGDIKLENAKLTTIGEDKTDAITFTVKKASYKAASTITITNVSAMLWRDIPAGEYALNLVKDAADDKDAYFYNYKDESTANQQGYFDTKKIELAPAYINVVTAGRDQDDSTFTTKVAVTIGANTMVVGQSVVALDVPAYLANGYTMLPVRAVADALSGNAATILWDDATKTVTIAFGARIISMTIGSKVMNINGVAIAMNAAPELTNGRTFLPMRDLAYALGLTEADIDWKDETKTATLN